MGSKDIREKWEDSSVVLELKRGGDRARLNWDTHQAHQGLGHRSGPVDAVLLKSLLSVLLQSGRRVGKALVHKFQLSGVALDREVGKGHLQRSTA